MAAIGRWPLIEGGRYLRFDCISGEQALSTRSVMLLSNSIIAL